MTQSFETALQAFSPDLPLAVGLSAGADSTALLVACARRWPGQVQAIHVHHGLQAAADGFSLHCAALCGELGVPLAVQHVDARNAPGESPEDAARQARYKAIEAAALSSQAHCAIRSIAIAQHADDQAETLLLALSRGAGVAGLAAMVEDPTNTDLRYTRNRIRAQLLPALDAVFPAFRETFARSASNAAQAAELLQEIASADLALVGTPPQIQALQKLSRARQANALRCWMRQRHQTTPTAAQLAELLDQIAACTTRGHRIHIKAGRGFVVRSGPHLEWLDPRLGVR
jgi:tRNA(Ile)-lysidine synthase